MHKPLSIFALATVRPSLVATSHPRPRLARSVPKPLSIFAVGTSAGPCCEVISLNLRCSHFGPALSLPAVPANDPLPTSCEKVKVKSEGYFLVFKFLET